MRRFIIPIFLFLLYQNAFTQQSSKFYGQVIDAQNGLPLELVIVYVPETNVYFETKENGRFSLDISATKNLIIKCSRLGYQTLTITLENWSGSKDQEFNISLIPITNQEIIIKENVNTNNSNIKENVKSFELIPTTTGNIESILPSIALGVRSSSGGELSSQYSVRGGSYDENLVIINDFEVFRPQLIRNGQQEGLTFPNADLIRELNFSSGGFESKYGDKSSSVLDIKYKVPDSLRFSIMGSLLGASGHLEGSKKYRKNSPSKINYLFGARYKTSKYLLASQDLKGEYQPNFLDLQSYITVDLNAAFQLAFIGNINRSQFKLIPEESTQAKGSISFVLKLNAYYEGQELDYFNQSMGGISLTYLPKNKKHPHFLKYMSAVYTGIEAEQFDILGYYRLSEIETTNDENAGKEIKLWGTGTQHLYTRNYLESLIFHNEIRGGLELRNKGMGGHFIQYGLSFRHEDLQDRINEWERIDSAGYSIPNSDTLVLLNSVLKTKNQFLNSKSAFWLQDEISLFEQSKIALKITPGVRLQYTELNQEMIFNPRCKFEWVPKNSTRNVRYWFSTGLYHQPPFYRELRTPNGSINEDLKSQKSAHFVAGMVANLKLKKVGPTPFKWISEIYYKKLWDVVSYDLDNVRILYSGQNDAEAYAIGWDNRINGEFAPGAESWVNLSFLRTYEHLYDIQHKVRESGNPNGKEVNSVPRPTDQFFSISMFFQDYLPRNPNFKAHLQATVASGLPYGFKGDNIVYRNEYRHKPYHRVDIGFSTLLWDSHKKSAKPYNPLRFCRQSWISLEVFNLLKVKNEASVRWIKSVYNYQFAIPNYLSSRRINLRLRFDF